MSWITIIFKLIACVWAVGIMLLVLTMGAWAANIDSLGLFIVVLLFFGSLVGFCCFAWSAWNDYLAIKGVKNHLKIRECEENE
ncbi:MAG: hypothetical protein LBU66_01700 [Treponema sp.]|jgi:hypothetical protein|nr:hypothetical protein [Treponema sp.]